MAHYEVPDKAPDNSYTRRTFTVGSEIPANLRVVKIIDVTRGRVHCLCLKVDNPPGFASNSQTT